MPGSCRGCSLTWCAATGRCAALHLVELLGTAALLTEPASRRAGSPRARAWLPLLDPRSGSPAETIACLRLHDAGLRPVAQAALRSASGRTLRPDFLFRA